MQLKNFLFIPLITLCAAGSKIHHAKNEEISIPRLDNGTVLLQYTGSLNGAYNIAVGAQVEMDSSIGFRYDVTFEMGSSVMSHVAFFYKFSNPYQTIYYNYLKHTSEVIKATPSAKETDVAVIGKETIDSFSCTHLHKQGDHEQQDYWMSTAVPGFAQIAEILKNIDPNLGFMVINQSIFNWGGLVRVKMISTIPKSGQTTTFTLNLIEAQTGLVFTAQDFEVPSK